MEWYTWVFGGIGVAVIGWLGYFLIGRKKNSNEGGISQSVGNNAKSQGNQTFRDIDQTMGGRDSKK